MNIALIFHNFIGCESEIIDTVNPCLSIINNDSNKLIGMRDIALDIEEAIYIDRKKIDWVLYATDMKIRWDDFLGLSKYVDSASDTIYMTGKNLYPWPSNEDKANLLGNFYCRPHVYAMLGNMYKLQMDFSDTKKSDLLDPFINTMVYAINRTGFDMVSIP
jgi:hypothetical protein